MMLLNRFATVLVLSLLLGGAMSYFGLDMGTIFAQLGLPSEDIGTIIQSASFWIGKNVLLGSLIVVPIALSVFIFSPSSKPSGTFGSNR